MMLGCWLGRWRRGCEQGVRGDPGASSSPADSVLSDTRALTSQTWVFEAINLLSSIAAAIGSSY